MALALVSYGPALSAQNQSAADDLTVVTLAPNVSLQLHGIAVAQHLRNDYYIGALYLPDWSPDPGQAANETVPKRLSMKVLADRLSAREFQRHWKELIALNNPRSTWQPQGERILKFAEAFQDGLQRGDQIDFDFLPGQGTRVRLNNELLVSINGDGFYPLLLSAWLGDIPPSKAFQSALLGSQDAEARARLILSFTAIPAVSRPLTSSAAIAAAGNPAPVSTATLASSATALDKAASAPAAKPAAKKPVPTATSKAVPPQPAVTAVAAAGSAPQPATTPAHARESAAVSMVATAQPVATPSEQVDVIPGSVQTEAPTKAPIASVATALVDEDLLLGEYKRSALQKIRKQLEYPPRAWRLGLTGSGVIRVQIDRAGSVLASTVVVSTGQMILDQAMVSMVERSVPLAALPAEVSVNELSLEIPVDFVR
ncbi:TonB family protein [Permianibacter sp. IMCC34836]|uniref:TonB family protein n=1 Tax=Permianibacter fluminis TaxID=2738515 RepID=UPI001556ED23|nr:TonB family protein [Permianibacter fluminis]NQD36454.1 TonB family protein [Permianibacter fluminis]